MTLTCQIDGCHQKATFHISEHGRTQHLCEIHGRRYLAAADEGPILHPEIDWDTYCSICGHDARSYTLSETWFRCPACSGHILDLTGAQHAVLTHSTIPDQLVHDCRAVPVSFDEDRLIVVTDFADVERLEKLRFVVNRRLRAVYADPRHIDSLLRTYF